MAGEQADAGTLTIDFVQTAVECPSFTTSDRCVAYSGFSSVLAFVFDVSLSFDASLSSVGFRYSEVDIDESRGQSGNTFNPYNAILLYRPVGHLGGYFERNFDILVTRSSVSVSGHLFDGQDNLWLSPQGAIEGHNGDQYIFGARGFWSARYEPSGLDDGTPFSVVAAVPIPASLPLLSAGLGMLVLTRRRKNSL
ncbi:VPLPA-CTERM sorting domain-containing protein [Pseudotabrizicola sediminis]|uniref:VPLPA-CTERM sorting domain-containing protein n=1 Tax=Pseudotabrizicola sediminis TaxID=2486418 RepID=UPI0014368880|nr:VPLPA-CTERM sorting domain-containing protein [Pseudotabrizicola sediminis]